LQALSEEGERRRGELERRKEETEGMEEEYRECK
jgi:hypothetical protein